MPRGEGARLVFDQTLPVVEVGEPMELQLGLMLFKRANPFGDRSDINPLDSLRDARSPADPGQQEAQRNQAETRDDDGHLKASRHADGTPALGKGQQARQDDEAGNRTEEPQAPQDFSLLRAVVYVRHGPFEAAPETTHRYGRNHLNLQALYH